MKFSFIANNRHDFEVGVMCQVLNVSRSGYYNWFNRPESKRQQEEVRLRYLIGSIHQISRGTYGSPRIHAQINNEGITCSPNRVARIMNKMGLRAKMKRRFKKTTDSKHNLPVASNLLKQDFKVDAENKVWASDITYVWTAEGWVFLAVVIDLFSRKVIGWSIADHMRKSLVIKALNMALMMRKPSKGAIHHSDRGSQYASKAYQSLLKAAGLTCSMSGRGNCYDNAMVESFFHTLKTEHIYFSNYLTKEEAKQSIFEFIEVFYNRQRIHSSLGYLSPVMYEDLARVS